MKRFIGWLAAWALFCIGHAASRTPERIETALYPIYNWCMLTSCDVQDWSGCAGPWGDPVRE